MSDLQDLIATNAVRAYNEGFERGVASEQERIIEVLEDKEPNDITSEQNNFWAGYQVAIALIKGEQK